MALPKAEDLLTITDVRSLTGLSESAVYRGVNAKSFPLPIKFGPKSNRWIRDEVEQWFADRIAEREVRH